MVVEPLDKVTFRTRKKERGVLITHIALVSSVQSSETSRPILINCKLSSELTISTFNDFTALRVMEAILARDTGSFPS